eukprot:CAMPEP_0196702592 /NCGR_PEP_ID=MMETSP1090-20130531/53953_1 /TAXON_ID=37098 /ORGANISM="Isochrysis sp, Strain CCMP1244" /LENGTH=132 /DNA_ID=CAMNT_0042042413 /DNA_START=128 /DNA_END=527 /DNA_ORIENTATION=+
MRLSFQQRQPPATPEDLPTQGRSVEAAFRPLAVLHGAQELQPVEQSGAPACAVLRDAACFLPRPLPKQALVHRLLNGAPHEHRHDLELARRAEPHPARLRLLLLVSARNRLRLDQVRRLAKVKALDAGRVEH